jgi:hypothetical protein
MMIKIIPYINTQVATHDDQNYSIYKHTGCYPYIDRSLSMLLRLQRTSFNHDVGIL